MEISSSTYRKTFTTAPAVKLAPSQDDRIALPLPNIVVKAAITNLCVPEAINSKTLGGAISLPCCHLLAVFPDSYVIGKKVFLPLTHGDRAGEANQDGKRMPWVNEEVKETATLMKTIVKTWIYVSFSLQVPTGSNSSHQKFNAMYVTVFQGSTLSSIELDTTIDLKGEAVWLATNDLDTLLQKVISDIEEGASETASLHRPPSSCCCKRGDDNLPNHFELYR